MADAEDAAADEGRADAQGTARGGALTRILPALVLSSALGYGVQVLAPLLISSPDYVEFSAFWSCLFLGIMALSGVQNEIARSSTPTTSAARGVPGRYSALIASGALIAGLAVGGVLGATLGSGHAGELSVATGLALGSYALMAILVGVLYGAHRWNGVTIAIVADPLLRALGFLAMGVLVFASIVSRMTLTAVVFVTVVPFLLAMIAVWFGGGRAALRGVVVEGSWTELLRRSFHTILAACALGFMASGQPLVIAAVGRDEDPALVAGAILVVVLVRAPLVSPMVALQSFLTVTFRDAASSVPRRVALISGGLLALSALAAVVVALVAPPLVAALLPAYTLPAGYVLVAAVLAAGLVGVQCVVGAAVLAAGSHRLYAAGWVCAALSVVAAAFVPLPFEPRLVLLLTLPVVVGLGVYAVGLTTMRGRAARHAPER